MGTVGVMAISGTAVMQSRTLGRVPTTSSRDARAVYESGKSSVPRGPVTEMTCNPLGMPPSRDHNTDFRNIHDFVLQL